MRNWPTWIPNLNAWMSALLLILLWRGLEILLRFIFLFSNSLVTLPPKLQVLLYFTALLSPIVIVAIAHHLLHLMLDRFYPKTPTPDGETVRGILPGLISWWEGWFGWSAIALAMLVSTAANAIVFSPMTALSQLLGWWDEICYFFTFTTLVRFLTLACLYQFEYLVRQHLLSVGRENPS